MLYIIYKKLYILYIKQAINDYKKNITILTENML